MVLNYPDSVAFKVNGKAKYYNFSEITSQVLGK